MTGPMQNQRAQNPDSVREAVEALRRDVAYLAERQRRQEELMEEMTPILKEVMATATARLDQLEKQGYFRFARELGYVVERVVEGYSADDVRALGDAVVGILDTVRTLTQPEVLKLASEAGAVVSHSDDVEPLGLVGMVRATRHEDVQRGMAVFLEVLRHVGRGADAAHNRRRESPLKDKRERLARVTGARRSSRALGTERPSERRSRAAASGTAASAPAPAKKAPEPVVVDGVAFGPDGHLLDSAAWTRELAERLAPVLGVELTPAHWRVIEFARSDFEQTGLSPNIRRITQSLELSTRDLYSLFPKAPARTIAKLAGTPKPAGCL